MADREADVGDTNLEEASSALERVFELVSEQSEALGRDRGQQAVPVTEVMGGGRVRHADPPGQRAKAQRIDTFGFDGLKGGIDHGPPEVAVVVSPRCGFCHGASVAGDLVIDKLMLCGVS